MESQWAKTKVLSMRVTEAEYQLWKQYAQADHRSLGMWVRLRVADALNKLYKPQEKPDHV